MPELKLVLSGPETVTLSTQTVKKLIKTGNGDAALLYLYILSAADKATPEDAAAVMGKDISTIESAMAELSGLGLADFSELPVTPQFIEPDFVTPTPTPTPTPAVSIVSDQFTQAQTKPQEVAAAVVKQKLENNTAFLQLVNETQQSLGRLLSPDDLERLFGIFDTLRLPPEVILLLITHCISESRTRGGRIPSMRYIEKAAYTWEREEVFTLEKAERHLKELEFLNSNRSKIKRALQIIDRELTASETRYVDEWIAMGFGADAIEIAYDRTVMQIGKPARSYINSILVSWHSSGLHSPEEILAKDGKPDYSKTSKNIKIPQQKFGVQDAEELKRMQRLLDKIKDGN